MLMTTILTVWRKTAAVSQERSRISGQADHHRYALCTCSPCMITCRIQDKGQSARFKRSRKSANSDMALRGLPGNDKTSRHPAGRYLRRLYSRTKKSPGSFVRGRKRGKISIRILPSRGLSVHWRNASASRDSNYDISSSRPLAGLADGPRAAALRSSCKPRACRAATRGPLRECASGLIVRPGMQPHGRATGRSSIFTRARYVIYATPYDKYEERRMACVSRWTILGEHRRTVKSRPLRGGGRITRITADAGRPRASPPPILPEDRRSDLIHFRSALASR